MEEFEFVDSDYLEISNDFINVQITAYVEGFDDMNFWCDVFRKYAPDLKIDFSPHSHDLSSGKQAVLTEENIRNTGKHLILCVDSDYDFLIGDERLENLYIFHTYTYSIENYKISPIGLESIVKKACFTNTIDFDFKSFLEDYSKCIYELFLYILYFRKQGEIEEPLLKLKELKKVIALKPEDIEIAQQGYAWLELVKRRTQQHIAKLSEKYPNITSSELQETLENCQNETNLAVNQSNLFLYFNGHLLYDSIEEILKKLTKSYKKKMIEKIENQENTQEEQRKQKKNEYRNKTKSNNWQTLLNDNHKECLIYEQSCPTMERIKQDIEKIL